MTVWKIEIEKPCGSKSTATRVRWVIDAPSFDAAVAAARQRAGAFGTAGGQLMDARELASLAEATEHFLANGFFPIFEGKVA